MRRLSVVLIVIAVLAAACSLRGDDNANGGLANTSWTVRSISGAQTVGAARPTMTFAPDGTLSGSTGCNQYSARFRTEGSAITIVQTSSTAVGCPGDRGPQEAAFLNALQGATSWRQTEDGDLVLEGLSEILAGPGVAEGPPDEPPAGAPLTDLAGTSWTLKDLGGTADFAHLVPTVVFGADGTISGFAGCNQFNAPYAISGSDLTLGSLATTKMACARPGSVVESTYLEALLGVKTWWIDDARELHLDGAVPLTFAPA